MSDDRYPCPSCGRLVASDAQSCPKCGKRDPNEARQQANLWSYRQYELKQMRRAQLGAVGLLFSAIGRLLLFTFGAIVGAFVGGIVGVLLCIPVEILVTILQTGGLLHIGKIDGDQAMDVFGKVGAVIGALIMGSKAVKMRD